MLRRLPTKTTSLRLALLLLAYLPLAAGQSFLHTCHLGDRCGEGACPERTAVVAGQADGHPSLLGGATVRHRDCAACVLCSHLQKGFVPLPPAPLALRISGAALLPTPPPCPAVSTCPVFGRAPPAAWSHS